MWKNCLVAINMLKGELSLDGPFPDWKQRDGLAADKVNIIMRSETQFIFKTADKKARL